MSKFRSQTLRSEEIVTSLGILVLDENGFVANQLELDITDEELSGVPGLISNDDFPLENFPLEAIAPEAAALLEGEKASVSLLSPTEVVVWGLLKDTSGKHFNSQGNLDLANLNHALLTKALPKVTGAERDAIVEKVKGL